MDFDINNDKINLEAFNDTIKSYNDLKINDFTYNGNQWVTIIINNTHQIFIKGLTKEQLNDQQFIGYANNTTPTTQHLQYTINEESDQIIDLSPIIESEHSANKISALSQPKNGVVALSGTSLLYQPNENFTGIETIKYELTDHIGSTSQGNHINQSKQHKRYSQYNK